MKGTNIDYLSLRGGTTKQSQFRLPRLLARNDSGIGDDMKIVLFDLEENYSGLLDRLEEYKLITNL